MEIFISTDVETDGPIPGPNSMLSLGAAAFFDGKLIDTFSINFEPLNSSKPDPDTEAWWKSQSKEIYDAARDNPIFPAVAIKKYIDWVNTVSKSVKAKPIFVGYPAGFDFLFCYWYCKKFGFESPFSFSALDIKTLAMSAMHCDYRHATKKNMPKSWFKGLPPHTHRAVDDAIEQGYLLLNILKDITLFKSIVSRQEIPFREEITVLPADDPKQKKICWTIHIMTDEEIAEENSPENLVKLAEEREQTKEADSCAVYHHTGVPKHERTGSFTMPVLQELWNRPWNAAALNFIHTLRPSCIRVTTGTITLDSCSWRVTVFLKEDNRTISKIDQEVEVDLRGFRNGHDASLYYRGKEEWLNKPIGNVFFNTRGIEKLNIKE